jgi:hypothetical protein
MSKNEQRTLIAACCLTVLVGTVFLFKAWIRSHSIVGYAEQAKKAVNLEELRTWALETLETYPTKDTISNAWNEVQLPTAPAIVERIPAPLTRWNVFLVLTNESGGGYVRLDSFGIDEALAIVVGPTNLVRTNAYSIKLAPGIYYEGSSIYSPGSR